MLQHRWTIEELLYYMVTEKPQQKWGVTTNKRARDISVAIFDQPAVINALSHAASHVQDFPISILTGRLQKELEQFHSHSGLGKFDVNVDPKDLNIPDIVEQVKVATPDLWELLKGLMESTNHSDRVPAKSPTGALLMICMTLAHFHAPRKCNSFQMLLGMHLHSMGVKRRTINLLAGLGITLNYRTIINHMGEVAKIAEISH